MELKPRADAIDKYRWECSDSKCKKSSSIRTNTWFAKSKLSIRQILITIFSWYIKLPQNLAANEAYASERTMFDWDSFCRCVCVDFIVLNSENIGGIGKVVEINESAFGKRKYNRGEIRKTFGGIERDSKPVKIYVLDHNIKKNEDKSLVVYNIKCKNCEANYIGKCKRILSYRISEHKKSSESSCCQHESNTRHTMDYDNIEIIDKADTDMKLRIKELLHILKRKPSLNKQLNSQSYYEIKTVIIQAYPQHRKTRV
ncbi:unnamed protein product [Brachionus calyciflorus]|uniref:GIY-YIG domain-containing protein n=1 Tax=Brachionus calyciflorus TaxID=104777 RepID=A0A813N5I8_9BILA|nr:unnamed protein product [Brachionus calyciflorus]